MIIGTDTALELQKLGFNVDGMALEDIPWVYPAMPLFAGAGSGFGSFAVPAVNSYVFVFFIEGDVYQPVYFAEAPTATMGLPSERISGYPSTRVFKTEGGVVISIDSSGNVTIDASGANGSVIIRGTTVSINP
ncbi:MAG: hypothetical protein ACTSVF_01280 [Candidatus Asgardarchaeia archaeon]